MQTLLLIFVCKGPKCVDAGGWGRKGIKLISSCGRTLWMSLSNMWMIKKTIRNISELTILISPKITGSLSSDPLCVRYITLNLQHSIIPFYSINY